MSLRLAAPLILFAASLAVVGCSRKLPAPAAVTPPGVSVTHPVEEKVGDYEDFAGRTESFKVVELRSRVSGYLTKIHFRDGEDIKAGAPLFDIDDRLYKADLHTAKAALASAEARRRKAAADEARAKEGTKTGVNAQVDLDQAMSDRGVAEADIGTATAAIERAETNLDFCKICAPFDGRLSKRAVDEGNLVKADDTMLTTLVRLDVVYATFDIDERTVIRVRRLIEKGAATSSRAEPLRVGVALADDDDNVFSHSGVIVFTDNQVDAGTGTLRARAVIPNPRLNTAPWYLLSPGQFVRVRVPIGPPRKAILVPDKAIGSDQGERYVYLVDETLETGEDKPRQKVVRLNVRTGQQYGNLRVVESKEKRPLTTADRVILEGLLRVRPGIEVKATEAKPEPKPDPGHAPAHPSGPEPARGAPAPHEKK